MDEIIQEVKAIRKYISVASVAIVIAVMLQIAGSVAAVTFLVFLQKEIHNEGYADKQFEKQSYEKLNRGDYAGLLKLTEERKVKYPNDPYVYYYLGLAYQGLGQHQKAIENFEKTEDIAPSWKEKYTAPRIKKSQKALGLPVEKD